MERNTLDHSDTAFRRMRQIEDCLYDMMQDRPYSSVSVSQICRKLDISRMTFYQYYKSKDACFRAIVGRLLREALIYFNSTVPADAASLEICTMMLDFWKQRLLSNNPHGSPFVANRLDSMIMDCCVRFVVEEDSTLLMPLRPGFRERDSDILACCIAGIYAMTIQWYSRGFDTPTEDMARKYLRILEGYLMILDPEQDRNPM